MMWIQMQQKQGRDVLGKKDEVEVEQGQLEEEEQDVAEVDGFKVPRGQDVIAAGKIMLELI